MLTPSIHIYLSEACFFYVKSSLYYILASLGMLHSSYTAFLGIGLLPQRLLKEWALCTGATYGFQGAIYYLRSSPIVRFKIFIMTKYSTVMIMS